MILNCYFRYEVTGCEVVWAVKDKSIGKSFFDEGAATFFLPNLRSNKESANPEQEPRCTVLKRRKYTLETTCKTLNTGYGSALGPDWKFEMSSSDRQVRYSLASAKD